MGFDRELDLTAYIRLLRPAQWLKNFMLFFPPFLGGLMMQPGLIQKGILPFISFCAVSSSTYIFNDILDARNDAQHPVKKFRPIPSGAIAKNSALILGFILACTGITLAFLCSTTFLLLLLIYLAIVTAYSFKFKDIPIVDIFCISAGFLLRLQAGGEVFGVQISDWLFLTVFLLAIFLSTGKRLGERTMLGKGAGSHRKSLLGYPDGFLDGIMYMTGAAVLVTYTMYVISRHTLIYTVPLCLFGLLRYVFLVKSGKSGDPTESLYKDKTLFLVGFFWAFMVGWSLYGR
jgi:decaprenyl-phosphate phosphoribosyltransferase